MFILLEDDQTEQSPKDEQEQPRLARSGLSSKIPAVVYDLVLSQHLHPISVHFPNGVLPAASLFTIGAILFDSNFFRHAATANMIIVILAMPFVIFSGYVDWKIKFKGKLTQTFLIKMICAATVSSLSLALALWWILDPSILASGSGKKALFVFLHLADLAAAGMAGYLGGKLVFGQAGKEQNDNLRT